MGDFSRDTFDKLKHYVGVRLQQGVPLVDADWNEMEDIRKDELQFFLENFVGSGIPKNNDGFRILAAPAGTANDFIIKGGTSGKPGCCIVQGRQALNEADILYTAQALFPKTGMENLAVKWGVAPLAPLTVPASGTRSDLVYIDVWEREVDSQEDPTLKNPAIGLETCVRIKRDWVVRVAEGAAALPAAPGGHLYYALATITRRAGQQAINTADVSERRGLGLAFLGDPITIQNNNVGLSNTNPTEKLEVNGNIKLAANQELFFADNGQVRSGDNNHRILFRRSENKMELREFGDIIISSGATTGNEAAKVTVKSSGNVGIGTTDPANKLHVVGDSKFEGSINVTGSITVPSSGPGMIPKGGIIMWSGAATAIPTGWALCDGSNSTPDLRNRFIVGAGQTYTPGNTGGADSVILTVGQLAQHGHGSGSATVYSHSHSRTGTKLLSGATGWYALTENWPSNSSTINISLSNAGSNQAHENRPPYYALCFIMKL